MGSKIFWTLILIVVCFGAYFMYDHYHQEKIMANGDVTCTGCMSPEESARFAKENAGETADGQSETKIRTARAEDAAGNPLGAQAPGQAAAAPTATSTSVTAAAPTATAAPTASLPAAAANALGIGSSAPPAGLPTTDSVPPNPTNGARFAGSGPYQWYRQGNLTWRVDTVSGRSCINYATMEEWQKPIVVSHGCGRGA